MRRYKCFRIYRADASQCPHCTIYSIQAIPTGTVFLYQRIPFYWITVQLRSNDRSQHINGFPVLPSCWIVFRVILQNFPLCMYGHALDLVVFHRWRFWKPVLTWLTNMSNSQSRSGTSFRVITIVQNSTCHQPPGAQKVFNKLVYTHSIKYRMIYNMLFSLFYR